MTISVFGLGYVGAVTAACFSSQGHIVWGVDVNKEKVDLISNGSSPIIEPGLADLLKKGVESGNLIATQDHVKALSHSQITLIAVATPSKPSGQIDSSHLLRACEQIADGLRKLNRKQLIVIRSSVLPQVFQSCKLLFDSVAPGLVSLCANPEFLREGSAINDFEHPPYTVIGSSDGHDIGMLKELYSSITSPVYVLTAEEAIMIKYASNVYHGLKVAFANEIGVVCKSQGINATNVMKVFTKDTKLNASARYLMPGFAFGGSCLPKDIRAVSYMARSHDAEIPMINSILSSNNSLIDLTVKKILSYKKKNIGLVGLSFKSNTDDLRESPFVELAERLLGKGVLLKIFDPNVSLARLMGANKAYIEEAIPHISKLLVSSMKEIASHSEVIIIGHNFKETAELPSYLKKGTVVYDLFNVQLLRDKSDQYDGIAW